MAHERGQSEQAALNKGFNDAGQALEVIMKGFDGTSYPALSVDADGKLNVDVDMATEGIATETTLRDVHNAIENLDINLSNQGFIRVQPTAYTVTNGTYTSGDIDSAKVQDNLYLVVNETSGDGLTVDFDFTLPTDKKVEEIVFKGKYIGSTSHWVDIYAYDYIQLDYVLLTNTTNRFSNTSEDITIALEVFNDNFTNASGECKIRLKHNTTSYINTHRLEIDYVHAAYVSAVEIDFSTVATETTLDLAKTEISNIEQKVSTYAEQQTQTQYLQDIKDTDGIKKITDPVTIADSLYEILYATEYGATYNYIMRYQRNTTNWEIQRETISTGLREYANGTTALTTGWSGRVGETYGGAV